MAETDAGRVATTKNESKWVSDAAKQMTAGVLGGLVLAGLLGVNPILQGVARLDQRLIAVEKETMSADAVENSDQTNKSEILLLRQSLAALQQQRSADSMLAQKHEQELQELRRKFDKLSDETAVVRLSKTSEIQQAFSRTAQ